jgi:demethylmenaquinone methyltransferase/2-methoxy-6-polyprenyl-1,4-benzoquinol methylase
MARVLRPGGQLLVLEFFRDDPAARGDQRGAPRLLRRGLGAAMPLLGRLIARDGAAYGYLPRSTERFLSVAEFAALVRDAGLTDVRVERQSFGVAHLVCGRK